MVKVTDKAKEELKKLLLSRTDDHESGIRLLYGSVGQFGLGLSREKDGDEVVYSDGLKVLMIGNKFTRLLDGVTFDVENNVNKREFVMTKK
jgi:Fe-S cluster assembly iron-binding protein IscA